MNNKVRIVVVPSERGQASRANARGAQFENLVTILLEALAFRVHSRKVSTGTEIDLDAESLVTGERAIVQCKDTKKNIDTAALQQLHSQATTASARVALLFLTTSLTPSADEYHRDSILPKFPLFKVYNSMDCLLYTSPSPRD